MTETPYRLRPIDRLYRWFAVRFYPRSDGDVFVIGPECFADLDATVVCWQGENYYRAGVETEDTWRRRNGHEPGAAGLLNLADDLSEEARVERLHAKDDGGTAHYAAGLEDAAERIRGVIEELRAKD